MGTFRRKRAGDPAAASAKAHDPEAARATAVFLLARRDFASGELRQKLGSQGYDATVAAAVVAELAEERLLDDARYAENFVAYHAGRGQGPVRIGADLRSLGVSTDLVEAAMDTVPNWPELARTVRIRKFGEEPPGDWAEKTRQARFLQYRGFSSDHIRAATSAEFDPDS